MRVLSGKVRHGQGGAWARWGLGKVGHGQGGAWARWGMGKVGHGQFAIGNMLLGDVPQRIGFGSICVARKRLPQNTDQ